MIFAGLLGARKKVPVWRIGRGTTWMRGHLWLGLLSFPFILFHSGFRLGAASLTISLMALFIIVVISGILGAALQHFVPRTLTKQVPLETVSEQIDHIRNQLLQEADTAGAELFSALEGDVAQAGAQQLAQAASAGTMGGVTVAGAIGADDNVAHTVRDFYNLQVRPYLIQEGGRRVTLSRSENATAIFQQVRILCPPGTWSRLNDLEAICDEKRQLDRQRTLTRLLHGWLLVHIPASYALLLLGAIHAVMALRY
jgi:hypothetical protein